MGKTTQKRRNTDKNGLPMDVNPAEMLDTPVTQTDEEQPDLAEVSGSSDKDGAVQQELAGPKVPTTTPDGADWLDRDPHGMKRRGLYGLRDRFPMPNSRLALRAQFLGRPLESKDFEEIHSEDTTAPQDVTCLCFVCKQPVTSLVKTAMVDDKGDLVRDKEGNVVYRGQFVVTGKPLTVHVAHGGNCLYKLRDARGKKKTLGNGRERADLLPSQSFDQANARLAGITASFERQRAEKDEFRERLGFKVGDVAHGNDGDSRNLHTPRLPRGQKRIGRDRDPRRKSWVNS